MGNMQPTMEPKRAGWFPSIALGILGCVTAIWGVGLSILAAAVLLSPPVHQWMAKGAAKKQRVYGTTEAGYVALVLIVAPWFFILALGLALMPFKDKLNLKVPEVASQTEKAAPTLSAKSPPPKPMPKPVPIPQPEPPKVRSAWRYSESEETMGERSKLACVESEDEIRQSFPYRNSTVTLCIRKTTPGGTDVFARLNEKG